MKLCYVANNRFPSERAYMTQIVQMCNAFVQQGHEITLLVTDRKTNIVEDPVTFFGVPINFSIVRVSVPDIAGRAPQIPVFIRPYAYFIQRIIFTYHAAAHINTQGYTHVYGRDEWILWFLTYLVRASIVWESHEAKFSRVAQRLIQKIKYLVVISDGIKNFYRAQGVHSEKLLVADDAVDDRFFESHISKEEARGKLGVFCEKPVVMYIGGLEDWKGAETLFEASRGQNDFETYVIGGKENELSLFREKYPHVHFLGPRPYRELPGSQQAADILVIPNTAKVALSSEYTSPLKLFAHMTSKKPIVASKIPSIANVLSPDEAYFFIPDDPASLRVTIVQMLRDPDGVNRRALAAYAKSKKYTWLKRAEKIAEWIHS